MEALVRFEEALSQALLGTLTVFNNPSGRLYWVYLAATILIAGWLFLSSSWKQGKRPSLKGFLDFCLPKKVRESPSAELDLWFFPVGQMVNLLVTGALGGAFLLLTTWTWELSASFFESFEWLKWKTGEPGQLTMIGAMILSAMVTDFAHYCAHYAQHHWSFLWEFHKVHHSATVMHPFTNFREHIVDTLLYFPLTAITGGFMGGLFQVWYPDNQQLAVFVFGVPIVAAAYNLLGYNLRHSHVWLAWPSILGRLFVSPANHQLHHSSAPRHMNRNFGFMFAIWDWIFGTLYLPTKNREEFEFGIGDGTEQEYSSIWKLYTLPFIKLFEKYMERPTGPTAGEN